MYHKSFFKKVVDELYSSYTSVDFKWHNDIHNPKKFISNFKKIVTNLIKSNGYSEEIAQKFYRAYHKRSEYYRHPLAWYGAVGKKFYNKHHTGGIETINSLLALQIIDEIGSIGETNK